MAAVAAGGLGLGAIKLRSFNLKPPSPSPFLGKKLKLKPSLNAKITTISRSKSHLIYAGVELVDIFHDLFVGVGVGLPCTVMACGDMIYRSTLPKSNELTITVPGVILALGTLSYLWATPGVAPGFWDMFVLAFVERIFRPTYRKVL